MFTPMLSYSNPIQEHNRAEVSTMPQHNSTLCFPNKLWIEFQQKLPGKYIFLNLHISS